MSRFLVAAAAGLLLAALPACNPFKRSTEADAGPPPSGEELFRQLELGREVMPARRIEPAAALGVWHYRVSRVDGQITRYERINPAGAVTYSALIERAPDGSRVLRQKNAYGVESAVETLDKDGIASRVQRSGERTWRGCLSLKHTFDEKGDAVMTRCLGADGAAVLGDGGCMAWRVTYGASHEALSQACLDEGDTPAIDVDGVHLTRFSRDADGNLTEEAFFGPDEASIARQSDGCTRVRYRIDAAGNTEETACLNAAGRPIVERGSDHAIERDVYDPNGCLIGREYADANGRPAQRAGVARKIWKRDQQCGILREESVGPSGSLVAPGKQQPAACDYELNGEGLIITARCFGPGGAPVSWAYADTGPGVGMVHRVEYDERGRRVRVRAFDQANKPARRSRDYPHDLRLTHGPDGLESSESHFDETGKKALGLGVARFEYDRDALGALTALRAYGVDDKPAKTVVGYASVRYRYDRRHKIEQIEVLGLDGEPSFVTGWVLRGVQWPRSTSRMVVERRDGVIANVFYNVKGDVLTRTLCADLSVPCYR